MNPEIGSDGKKVPHTSDPAAWAATFVRIIHASHKMELPVESMKTWFEGCLKAGFNSAIEKFLLTEARVYGCSNANQIRAIFTEPTKRKRRQHVRMKRTGPYSAHWQILRHNKEVSTMFRKPTLAIASPVDGTAIPL